MSLPTFSHPSNDQADLLSSWDLACSGWYGCRPQFNSKWSATLLFSPQHSVFCYHDDQVVQLLSCFFSREVLLSSFLSAGYLAWSWAWPLNFCLTVAKGVEVPGPVLLSVFTLHPLTAVHLASESESLRWTALPTPPPSFSSPFSLEIHIYVCTFCLDIDTPSSTGQEWL